MSVSKFLKVANSRTYSKKRISAAFAVFSNNDTVNSN